LVTHHLPSLLYMVFLFLFLFLPHLLECGPFLSIVAFFMPLHSHAFQLLRLIYNNVFFFFFKYDFFNKIIIFFYKFIKYSIYFWLKIYVTFAYLHMNYKYINFFFFEKLEIVINFAKLLFNSVRKRNLRNIER
jgi:hypothetical protein